MARKHIKISFLLPLVIGLTSCAEISKNAAAQEQPPLIEQTEAIVEKDESDFEWTCKGCSPNEVQVLQFLQKQGITDQYALATVLGNIQQESRFVPNICEGGARVSYDECLKGGFGLIQWTAQCRFDGLGRHSKEIGLSPSTLEAQLSFMVVETEWKTVEKTFKKPGLSKKAYMDAAYRWLGWGIYGARGFYTDVFIGRLESI